VRVFLTAVRAPEADGLTAGGYADQAPWPEGFAAEAWAAVVRVLREVATAVMAAPSITEFRRGYLAFYGTRMTGGYRAGGWRLATPHFPEDPEAAVDSMPGCPDGSMSNHVRSATPPSVASSHRLTAVADGPALTGPSATAVIRT
jgi:hypothetical protein